MMRKQSKTALSALGFFILGAAVSVAFCAAITLSSPASRIKSACIEDGGKPQVIFNIPDSPQHRDYGSIECIFPE